MKQAILKSAFAALALAFAAQAMADQVTPVSYTFDQPTTCDSWCYHDPSLSKLTDGVIGNAGWAHNAGAEWAGWVWQPVVNIDFSFAAQKHFTSVAVGSTQDSLGDVALPSFDLWAKEGNQWVLKATIDNPASNANNNDPYSGAAHPFYTFSNLNFNSDQVRVTARANGPWTFVDEVVFQATPVPEPESWAMMLGGLALLGLVHRKRKAAK